MAEPVQHHATENPVVDHEHSDVPLNGLAFFLASLVVVLIATCLFLYWLFGVFFARALATDPPPLPLVSERTAPPPPRLQVAPPVDMDELRKREAALLDSYGWVSREDDIARIPIERAIQLAAEEGLPQWPAATDSPRAATAEDAAGSSDAATPPQRSPPVESELAPSTTP